MGLMYITDLQDNTSATLLVDDVRHDTKQQGGHTAVRTHGPIHFADNVLFDRNRQHIQA